MLYFLDFYTCCVMADSAELLNTLRDIHVPPPVSWWPPALGWWLLLSGIFVGVVLLWWWLRRAQPWRRQALRRLRELELEFRATGEVATCVAQVSVLLRRVALSMRVPTAAVTGDAWLNYLDELGRTEQFSTGIGRVLITAPYARAEPVDVPQLIKLVRRWIKKIS